MGARRPRKPGFLLSAGCILHQPRTDQGEASLKVLSHFASSSRFRKRDLKPPGPMLGAMRAAKSQPKRLLQVNNQLKTDIAKLRKVAEETAAYIKELGRELDDCVEAINNKQPPARDRRS